MHLVGQTPSLISKGFMKQRHFSLARVFFKHPLLLSWQGKYILRLLEKTPISNVLTRHGHVALVAWGNCTQRLTFPCCFQLTVVGMYASSYVLVMAAVDRYVSICHPLTNQTLSPKRIHLMILLAWGLSLFFSIPQIFIFSLHDVSQLVSWCFKPSQPQRIISGLRETFIKRYIDERTNRAE